MVHRRGALGHHRSAIELLAYSKGGDIEGYSYGNPENDALFEQIDCADISYAQEGLMEQGWQMILQDDILVVPLYRKVVVWAMRNDLDLPISRINLPYFREARLNPP